jgi:hypothetical protein
MEFKENHVYKIMLDITKMMNDLKIRKPEIYAELIKIHYIKKL